MCSSSPSPGPYPSDLTDEQWALVEPLLPASATGGRPEKHSRRDIVDAILYLLRTGCSWRQLPADFPPWRTVYGYFAAWHADGTLDRVHDRLRDAVRDAEGRDPMASAGIIDAQSVKAADTVGTGSRGYDAGKRTNGRKRHIAVDTLGLLVVVTVTAASIQDRNAAIGLLARAKTAMPSLATVFADGGYTGRLLDRVRQALHIVVEIVAKPDGQRGFAVLPRRWVVERTFAWLTRCRRLDRDYERLPAHAEAMIKWAMIGHMIRRLAPAPGRQPWQPAKAT